VTFKELKNIIAEQQKELDVQSKTYNPDHYWNGKKIIPLNEWRKIANSDKVMAYGIEYQKTEEALKFS
jgi:hypothetical protein